MLPEVSMMTLLNAPLADAGETLLLESNWILRQIFRQEGKCLPPLLVFPSSELAPRSFRRRTPRLRASDPETTGVNNVKKV